MSTSCTFHARTNNRHVCQQNYLAAMCQARSKRSKELNPGFGLLVTNSLMIDSQPHEIRDSYPSTASMILVTTVVVCQVVSKCHKNHCRPKQQAIYIV
jgi:hypothetical protein